MYPNISSGGLILGQQQSILWWLPAIAVYNYVPIEDSRKYVK